MSDSDSLVLTITKSTTQLSSSERLILQQKEAERRALEFMKPNFEIRIQKSRDITNGFIKTAQLLFNGTDRIIPPEIGQVCLLFYHGWNKLKTQNMAIHEKKFYKYGSRNHGISPMDLSKLLNYYSMRKIALFHQKFVKFVYYFIINGIN